MPEPLKNVYTSTYITQLADELTCHYAEFDHQAFINCVFDKSWQDKELKQRMRHIAYSLHQFLPENYNKAIAILMPASTRFSGFEAMFFQDYVECFGLEDFDTSMQALAHFTQYSSAEFAVRQFIIKQPERMMTQMQQWATSDNYHLRRLASEGCRPRLPWAIALEDFKQSPEPVLKILHGLMQDESDYVRRSVANNLNDISKDHPEVTLQWAKQWSGKLKHTDWIIKHGCRTLLKQAHPQALKLFGYINTAHIQLENFQLQPTVKRNYSLAFSFSIRTNKQELGKLRLEYAIDFKKANGKQSRKVFKIGEASYSDREKVVSKNHSFKAISTRKHYPGEHALTILINGETFATGSFMLS